MEIYILTRTDYVRYDEYDAKVIVAKNENRARAIANDDTGDEGNVWSDKSLVACRVVSKEKEGVVLAFLKSELYYE